MKAEIPFFILCVLIHIGVYLSSGRPDRRLKLMAGLAVLFNTWPAWYGGVILAETSATGFTHYLGVFLRLAPLYLPLLSFLVYLKQVTFNSGR